MDTKLGTQKIPKLLLSLAIPAVTAQLINVLYNIVDRIYIGNIPDIGANALTGVGVTFSIILIISAFSAFVGMGGAPLASIKLGENDKDGAERILGNSVVLLLTLSVILTTAFLIFKQPLLLAFGASPETLPYANDYITIYLYGTIFVQISLGLNTFISTQGFAKTAMISVLIGAVTNIVLDPILIFGFNMGVKGAAIATVASQALSAIWVLSFLFSGKSILRIRKIHCKLNPKVILTILALGISPFIMQSTESLVQITLNSGMQRYGGDLYVGSITIITSIMQMFTLPINGFAQGAQPILSYNYGAGNLGRVKQTFWLMVRITLVLSTLCTLAAVFLPHVFARMFTPEQPLIDLVSKAMPIFMSGIWIFGAQLACQATFLALGQAKISVFIALLRKIVLLIPLAIILPRYMGAMGIYWAEPIADITAALTTVLLFSLKFNKILTARQNQLNLKPSAGDNQGI